MYGQDLDFVVAILKFLFICMVLFGIAVGVMRLGPLRRK